MTRRNEAADTPDAVTAIALLDEPKRRQLYDYVLSKESAVGRDEAASAAGISRELAAFHLDKLVEGGLLTTEYRRLGGRQGPGAGRPAKLYRRAPTELTVSLPPRRYQDAAALFAEALNRRSDGAAVVAQLARSRGEAMGRAAREALPAEPDLSDLERALIGLLADCGYEPEDCGDEVCLLNCPYDALARSQHDLTCGMNLAWAKGVVAGLGAPQLKARRSVVPGRCCVAFRTAKDRD